MAERPGFGTQDDTGSVLRDALRPREGGSLSTVDVMRPPQAERARESASPRVEQRIDNSERYKGLVKAGVLELTYGDPEFDAKLGLKNYETLKIKGLPEAMRPSPWVDKDGKGYFFWFRHDDDNTNKSLSDRTRHYFPANVKNIEIERKQGHFNEPEKINADEMRIAATQVYMKEQNGNGFASYGNSTSVFKYAQRMGEISMNALTYQEKLLREAADSSPTNPYFRIYLSDVLAGEAAKPIVDGLMNNQPVRWDNPETLKKLDEAIIEIKKAQKIIQTTGDFRVPVMQETPLSPFMWGNSDFYWSGASYQAYRREVQLVMLKQLARMGQIPIELPPDMTQRR